jgi:dTDP-N-acetylfucosamine:lipid II N-acetylfucosaminyltransferase
LFGWDKKFVPPFIELVRAHFDDEEHRFIIYGWVNDAQIPSGANVIHYNSLLKNLPGLLSDIRGARKVILHGLFSSHLLYVLALHPWVLKKCYWTIWGGDLYIRNAANKDWRWRKNEIFRRLIIGRIGHFITHIKGDYELARQWYGGQGQWHECFLYPSNLYQEQPIQSICHEGINILVGNSADPSNNHKEVLDNLRPHALDNIRIYCPLSYGDQTYAQEISDYGKSIFGEKFVALRGFMPFDEYLQLLAVVDIGIFNHHRQQGMGNATALLGMGKKLYMRREVTSRVFFDSINVTVHSLNELNTNLISASEAIRNTVNIKRYFSIDCLIRQWARIFNH